MSKIDIGIAGGAPATNGACVNEDQQVTSAGLTTKGVDDLLEIVIRRYIDERDELMEAVRRLNALRTRNEDARKRCLSVTLVSTPNAARIQTLRGVIFKQTEKMKPLLRELLESVAVAEIARQQLHIYLAAERQIQGERAARDQRQLTPLTYDFVDVLYKHYGVDGSALSCLDEADYGAIAEIVRARHAATVPEAYGDR